MLGRARGSERSHWPAWGICGVVALPLCGVLLALLVLEILFRVFFPQDLLFHDYGKVMRLRPDGRPELIPNTQTSLYGTPVRINSLGFRGKEYAVQKDGNVFRIVVLGDSVTFGVGVDDAAVFTRRMEDLLRQRRPSAVEVINLGVVGYDLDQELAILRAKGLSLMPDLVIVGVTLNDLESGDSNEQTLFNLRVSGDGGLRLVLAKAGVRLFGVTNAFLRTRLHVYNFVKTRFVRFAFQHQILTPDFRILELTPGALHGPIGRFAVGLRELKSIADRHRFSLLVVIFPYEMELSHEALEKHRAFYRVHLADRVLEAYPQQELRRLCEALAIPVLDLLETFRARESEGLFLNQPSVQDFVHLSPRGHAVAAEAIVRSLRRNQ